ncbi:MAG: PQQ-dependent sugar dehydrogenase [Solimonas sp.]
MRFNIPRPAWIGAVLASTALLAHCGGDQSLDVNQPPQRKAFKVVEPFELLNFVRPVFVTSAPGDTRRLFVVEQAGRIYSVDRTTANPGKPQFLNIRTRVATSDEQGLLGLAFDPAYASNGYFYVYYSAAAGTGGQARSTVVARYTVSSDPNVADPTSELKLLTIPQPAQNANHNGGWIGFGPDGKLYVAVGDGGGAGDPDNNAQNLSLPLGKILRINTDGSIPADNPYFGQGDRRGEIWAFGLRNPFRASFDRATGTLWAGDVGQEAWEEIDTISKGANYGWRKYEGSHVYNPTDPVPPDARTPVYEYDHGDSRCSVIGGYVYRGGALDKITGVYLYADYCSKQIWGLSGSGANLTRTEFDPLPASPTSFGEDIDGEVYITAADGNIYKLVPAD